MERHPCLIFMGLLMPVVCLASSHPSPDEVRRNIKDVVVFAIQPDTGGTLVSCSFSAAMDIKTKRFDKNFHPSRAFVKEACNRLSNGRWKVSYDQSNHVKVVYDFCYWSKAAPDKPICAQRLEQNDIPQLSPNAPKDKPQKFTSNQVDTIKAAIAPYIAEARQTYPSARARFLRGLPPGEHFFVTTTLYGPNGMFEQVFVKVQRIEKNTVYGVIDSQIKTVPGYKLGEKIKFSESEIVDWLITHPDGTEEGNVVGKFLDTYRPSRR